MIKRALISVFDKTGVVEFARGLTELGVEIVSTGGTYRALREAGVENLIELSDVTEFPEMLDGRVKTLHPRLHGGILAVRDNEGHMSKIGEFGIRPVDLVVCNLYPFAEVAGREGAELAEVVENIDIGGPSMLRAAAKNYKFVTAVIDPKDYGRVMDEVRKCGDTLPQTRFELAAKVFAATARYDALIAAYLNGQCGGETFPETISLTYVKKQDMHYGENPHQKAAFYMERPCGEQGLADAVQLHGRELSFNNINDAHGALELLMEFDKPAAVASKHSNPCGVGEGGNAAEAFKKAFDADPVSIFGGIIAFNREVGAETAKLMGGVLLDIIIAPSFSKEALEMLAKKKNTRLLAMPSIMDGKRGIGLDIKKVSGGVIIQEKDRLLFPNGTDITDLRVVTKRAPNAGEYADLLFAWKVVKHVKSNAIVIGKAGQSVGIGCGQVNRIWAAKQAIEHGADALGKNALAGAALASDAFFPFDDCVEAAAAAGITAIIQPGGSVRDGESVDACDRNDIAMLFTGMRHFRH